MTDNHATTIVFLPGSLCDERLFKDQRAYFEKTHNVIVVDLSQQSSIASMAEQVLSVAPDKFILVGLSMGGIVALEIMRTASERVLRLALLGTTPWQSTPDQIRQRENQIEETKRRGIQVVSELADTLFGAYVTNRSLSNTGLRDLIYDMACRGGVETLINHWQAVNTRDDLSIHLHEIACPTLVICGAEDRICPPEKQQKMASTIPTATLAMIENCGHLSTLESSDEVNHALDSFVNSTIR